MPSYRRFYTSGTTYFFTLATHQRKPVLIDEKVRTALRCAIASTRNRFPFEIMAWVLMPDHLHCIWRLPDDDPDYSLRWSIIRRLVTQRCEAYFQSADPHESSRSLRCEGGLWQRRLWEHVIRDEDDFRRHIDYIHWNPVKHGYVSRACDWPWSTFHRYVEEGVYSRDWADIDEARFYGYEYGE